MVEWKKLGEVCSIFDGTHQTPKYTDSGIKFVSVENINGLYNSNKFISEEDFNANYKTKPQRNDVLMTRIGDVGSCAIVDKDEPLAYYVSLALLRPNSNVISGYIKYILESRIGKIELRKRTLLTAVPLKINLGDVGKVCIPIPSLSEQNRIVGILDTFTASIENLKEQIAQRRKQYEYYRDQLLDLEGKEGVEMKYLLDVLAQPVTDGPHETPSFYEDGIPFISADAIVDNKINFSRKRGYISEEYDRLCQKKYKPQLNDIYLVKSGSTTGKVAIVRTDERFNIWSPLAAIRVNQRNHPYFVYYMLQTKKVQDQVKLKSSQGSQPNLSMRVLEKFIIPVPPLSEQQRIVSILDTFEASIQNLEAQLSQREKQYEYYRNKLLTFED